MNAEQLDRMTAAHRESQIVFAALRLGLFEHLAARLDLCRKLPVPRGEAT